MTALLLAATIFLGMNMLTGGMNKPADVRKASEIYANLQKMNAEGREVSIQTELHAYQGRLNEEARNSKEEKAVTDSKQLKALLLAAHAQTKAGLDFNKIDRLQNAFNALDGARKTYGSMPIWENLEVEVTPGKNYPESRITASSLYEKTVTELSARNKVDLVWGFFPGYAAIDGLVKLTGSAPSFSYAFAALLLALVVRAIVYPLAQKQLMWSKQMMQLQPLVKEIKEKYTNKQGQVTDSVAMQKDTMGLYSDYGINPAAGCGPALLQLPLFLLVFQSMLHYRFEFLKGTFLWINPGSHAAMGNFVAPNLGQSDTILLVIYGISMVIATYLQPVNDPSNAKQQRVMGVAVSVAVTVMMFFYPLPSAFVLYWIFLNLFSTAQSLRAAKLPVPPLTKVATSAGGARAKSGFFQKLMEESERQMNEKNKNKK